jgi:hypothetical protein
VKRHVEPAQHVTHRAELLFRSPVDEIADHEAEIRFGGMGAHAGRHALKPCRTFRARVMSVIDFEEGEVVTASISAKAGASWPKPEGKGSTSAVSNPFTTGLRTGDDGVHGPNARDAWEFAKLPQEPRPARARS